MDKEVLSQGSRNAVESLTSTPGQGRLLSEEDKLVLRERRQAMRQFIASKVGKHYRNASFTNGRATKTLKHLETVALKGRLTVIQGGNGCGKTFAATAWLKREIMLGHSVDYIKAVDFMNDVVKKLYAFMNPEAEMLLSRLKRVDSLVIDDVGAENINHEFQSQFAALIDYRYSHELTTVIISNIPFEDWPYRYGESIVSRICEWARGLLFQTDEPDLRRVRRSSARG